MRFWWWPSGTEEEVAWYLTSGILSQLPTTTSATTSRSRSRSRSMYALINCRIIEIKEGEEGQGWGSIIILEAWD